ncbi:MAG: hypothetical protein KJ607_09580 [Bacteroidetes bacterium]|nr:hypothetical protein [Bacteroidota bacterium]
MKELANLMAVAIIRGNPSTLLRTCLAGQGCQFDGGAPDKCNLAGQEFT